MTVRAVVVAPSNVLSTPARKVLDYDDSVLQKVRDLIDTMVESPGCVGLASVQLGLSDQIFVVDVSKHKKTDICHGLIVAINPVIIHQSDPHKVREGCLSVPDFTGSILRYGEISIKAFDVTGCEFTISTNAFEAQAIQHEIDHLNGKVFLDRVLDVADVYPRKRYL